MSKRVYYPGDPEPPETCDHVLTRSGWWLRNGRRWQHENALTDMGDMTWDELLEVFGSVVALG